MFVPNSMVITATYKGWTIKPTPRSETAKLRSNSLRGFGYDAAFLQALIVTLFNMMAIIDK